MTLFLRNYSRNVNKARESVSKTKVHFFFNFNKSEMLSIVPYMYIKKVLGSVFDILLSSIRHYLRVWHFVISHLLNSHVVNFQGEEYICLV